MLNLGGAFFFECGGAGQTPATCSNIALHNIYPGEIDLVLSGPNREFQTHARDRER